MALPYLHIQYSTSRRFTDPSELKCCEIGNPNAGIIFSSLLSSRVGFYISNQGDIEKGFQCQLLSVREKVRGMERKTGTSNAG